MVGYWTVSGAYGSTKERDSAATLLRHSGCLVNLAHVYARKLWHYRIYMYIHLIVYTYSRTIKSKQ